MGFLGPLPIPLGIAEGPVPAATPEIPTVILISDEPIYEVWLSTDQGSRIALIQDFETLEYAIVANEVGPLTLMMGDQFDREWINPDWRIDVYRTVRNRTSHEIASFIRYGEWKRDSQGTLSLKILAMDANYHLWRRRVAYDKGTSYAEKSDLADDMAKEIVKENLGGSAVDSDRDLTGWDFSVASDLGLGPTVDGIVPVGETSLEFRTWIDQPGLVCTYPGSDRPVLFSSEAGNLWQPKLVIDWRNEENYIYAGWGGSGSDREIEEISDDARINESVWNRDEGFFNAQNMDTLAALEDAAKAALTAGRPGIKFEGTLISSPKAQTLYGVHWGWGDMVTMEDFGTMYDGIIESVKIRVEKSGEEKITAKVVSND
jgi:hypothetical protein